MRTSDGSGHLSNHYTHETQIESRNAIFVDDAGEGYGIGPADWEIKFNRRIYCVHRDRKKEVIDVTCTGTYREPEAQPLPDDMVNHPKHYNSHPSGVECIDVIEHMPFNIGNAIKYVWRADHKGSQIQDLNKAIWYLQREVERLQKMEAANGT